MAIVLYCAKLKEANNGNNYAYGNFICYNTFNFYLFRNREGWKMKIDFVRKPLYNSFYCPRCLAAVKIPIDTPGQAELFPPNCYYCGGQMRQTAENIAVI